jgi:hypothetical protein
MDANGQYVKERLVSPSTSFRSHYGNPHVAAYYHQRSPSSPSTFSRFLVDKTSSHEQEDPFSEKQTSSSTFDKETPTTTDHHPLSLLPLALESSEVGPEMPASSARSQHHRFVTPNASFAERDPNDNSLESHPDVSFPVHFSSGGCSPGQHSWSSASKRASVGLPSLYPGHYRSSSLSETVMEELQDFDELFLELSTSAMDTSRAFEESSYSRNRLSNMSTSESHVRDDLFLDLGLDAPSAILSDALKEEEESKMEPPTPAPKRRGRHRRSGNHAMDQDFLSQVIKQT